MATIYAGLLGSSRISVLSLVNFSQYNTGVFLRGIQ